MTGAVSYSVTVNNGASHTVSGTGATISVAFSDLIQWMNGNIPTDTVSVTVTAVAADPNNSASVTVSIPASAFAQQSNNAAAAPNS